MSTRAPQEMEASGSRLFSVSNNHTECCGEPPTIDGDQPGFYFGYFANEYGEQAIYTYDRETEEATLKMGDTGWSDIHRVVDGEVEGLLLTLAEQIWLHACWMATGGLKTRLQAGAERSQRKLVGR